MKSVLTGEIPIQGLTIGSPSHSFKEVSAPTIHAKRNIIFVKPKTTFFLIIVNIIMEYIKKYTEAEALRVLETK
ncbi:piggyBac transposable element-derived protein 4-like [Vespula squamosa]|uniref:PiggyBac transposable element-derived protein 4-like n=1 Tax=Vespula squamosa TaxID=30214 RepID=A0ABD2BG80_VESSQ